NRGDARFCGTCGAPFPVSPFAAGQDWVAGRQAGLQDLLTDIKLLRYDTLFPLGRWLVERPWNVRWIQAALFFALFPMAIATLFDRGTGLRDVVWALGLYFSLLWGVVLYWLIAPPRLSAVQVILVAVFTAIVGVWLLLFVQELPIVRLFYAGTEA